MLTKYHLMEVGSQPADELTAWVLATPLLAGLWERFPPRGVATAEDWVDEVVGELVNGGALRLETGTVFDA